MPRKETTTDSLTTKLEHLIEETQEKLNNLRDEQIRRIVEARDRVVNEIPEYVFTREEVIAYIDEAVVEVGGVFYDEELIFNAINT